MVYEIKRGFLVPLLLTSFCAAALLLATLARPTQAQKEVPERLTPLERITDFHSDITVHADGSMTVRETIQIRAAGERIKRGIFRDFPTRYTDRYGNHLFVGFELLGVLRDGRPEPYHTEVLPNAVRVYMGEKSVSLSPGEYSYALTFRTDRQLGFFNDHDELYWNVTGNAWDFVIDRASATVRLPPGIKPEAMLLDAFTGSQGSQGRAFQSVVEGESQATFSTTAPLESGKGLTILVSFPKGFVTESTAKTSTVTVDKHGSSPPFTLDQVEKLVRLPAPDDVVSGEIKRRGLNFTPSKATLENLRAMGAGPQTLKAVTELVPLSSKAR